MKSDNSLSQRGGTHFSGPVTLRPGVTRTLAGKRYSAGNQYPPDDPGVVAAPHLFILATPPKSERMARLTKPEPEPEKIEDEPQRPPSTGSAYDA